MTAKRSQIRAAPCTAPPHGMGILRCMPWPCAPTNPTSSRMGPRGPTVMELLLFHTGAPLLAVQYMVLAEEEGRTWGKAGKGREGGKGLRHG